MNCRGIGSDVAQQFAVMSVSMLRTWAVIAALVAVQVPATAEAAGKSGARRARVDRQIEKLERQGLQSNQSLRLIVEPGRNTAAVMKALRSRGAKIRRQFSRIGRLSVE